MPGEWVKGWYILFSFFPGVQNDHVMFLTCDILALIAAFEGSIDVASIANRKLY